jgi:hypothetical protein
MNGIALTKRFLSMSLETDLHIDVPKQNALLEIYSQEEFHAILVREKARADRNGHGFSLVTFEVSNPKVMPYLAEYLMRRIRTTDDIGRFDHDTLGVFLYNTPALGAWQFVNKCRKKTDDDFPRIKCKVYSYPNSWCDF